jgi:hypothetical protein
LRIRNPFRYFNSSPEVIRLTVMMYVPYPLSLRQVEDLLSERGIDICHETVRFWWNRFAPDVCRFSLALAFGRGFSAYQRRDTLTLAGSRLRRRGS